MSEHKPTLCDHCGQVDDHPKSHWNSGESFHLDCVPYDKQEELFASHPLTRAQVEAAKNGTHGDDLRAFIKQQHEEAALEGEDS